MGEGAYQFGTLAWLIRNFQRKLNLGKKEKKRSVVQMRISIDGFPYLSEDVDWLQDSTVIRNSVNLGNPTAVLSIVT